MKYLELAARIAQGAAWHEKHFLLGAVAIRGDGAIVTATNIRTQDRVHSAHAEYRALKKAGKDSILYVARIDRFGQWAMAKPCNLCQTLIKNKRVRRVYYTIAKDEFGVMELT
jgi:tRNA(Arg) A34 adenosine deaminase TadA